jgi:hypothetical protein
MVIFLLKKVFWKTSIFESTLPNTLFSKVSWTDNNKLMVACTNGLLQLRYLGHVAFFTLDLLLNNPESNHTKNEFIFYAHIHSTEIIAVSIMRQEDRYILFTASKDGKLLVTDCDNPSFHSIITNTNGYIYFDFRVYEQYGPFG